MTVPSPLASDSPWPNPEGGFHFSSVGGAWSNLVAFKDTSLQVSE
jgi:hypothetical protein